MKALSKLLADRFASVDAFAAALAETGTTGPRPPSVAVLPFLNLSPDPENEYFADGITEDVIAQLSKVGALQVISRTSVMPYKKREQGLREIAARLQVATVLEGSVRRAGDRVRIVAQLIDADSDQHLWTETYDRQLTDIFAIQADVAMKIARALEAELKPDERARIGRVPTRDLEAYQLFLLGRHWFSRYTGEGFRKGLAYFEQAVARDPGFALAHTGLALAWTHIGVDPGSGIAPSTEAYRHAQAAVKRALALDAGLGEAHGVQALLKFVCDYDWAGAEEEFRLALELSPGSADLYDHFGWLRGSQGRHDEEFELAKRARELDPMAHGSDAAAALLRGGRYEEALREATRAVDFDPRSPRGHSTLGWAHLKLGHQEEGLAELDRAVALDPENTLFLGQRGQALAEAGRTADARAVLQRLEQMAKERVVSPYHIAYIHVGLGDHEAALTLLERAFAERSGGIYAIKGSFLFTALHPHPRFIALLRKMNLL
jgi:serine/threonine-protein kinase